MAHPADRITVAALRPFLQPLDAADAAIGAVADSNRYVVNCLASLGKAKCERS
jgi:hypothetical protein